MADCVWCWKFQVLSECLQTPLPTLKSHLLEDLEVDVLWQAISLKFASFSHPCNQVAFGNVSEPGLLRGLDVGELFARVVVVLKE